MNSTLSYILSIAGAAITVAISFYIKDFLQKKNEYNAFRKNSIE